MAETTRKTFVLVHGAWHGGWCWRRVADLLERAGHKVFTPTLTGLGERSHLLSTSINLDTHITDIVNVFKCEDLKDVCLVVHSYGGWPGSGALEQIGDRVSSIVWLDAFKPENGERPLDTASSFARDGVEAAVARGEPGRPAPDVQAFGVNEADRAWVTSKLTPQPTGVYLTDDQAHRRARQGGEEDLHPRTALSAAGFRQGLCRMQGRQDLADVRDHHGRARRHGRRPAMAGGDPAEGVVDGRTWAAAQPHRIASMLRTAAQARARMHQQQHVDQEERSCPKTFR